MVIPSVPSGIQLCHTFISAKKVESSARLGGRTDRCRAGTTRPSSFSTAVLSWLASEPRHEHAPANEERPSYFGTGPLSAVRNRRRRTLSPAMLLQKLGLPLRQPPPAIRLDGAFHLLRIRQAFLVRNATRYPQVVDQIGAQLKPPSHLLSAAALRCRLTSSEERASER